MKKVQITLPELILVAGTRAMLGAGAGLLLADRLPEHKRKAVGWTLFVTGAISTIPLALHVLCGKCAAAEESSMRLQGDAEPEPGGRLGRRSMPGIS